MEWWPGLPHAPNRDALKVRAIQRSLDWKRVLQIAAYLLQQEIEDAGSVLDKVFGPIYEPKKNEPGREWPPQIRGSVKFARSSFPFFSNVLVHVNGATLVREPEAAQLKEVAELGLNPSNANFYLTVIDGQHRINGAYLALKLRQESIPETRFDVPTEVFIDLDPRDGPPIRQAQIFIDVNLNQKKVDRSLVADLFPLARGRGEPIDRKERAQDIGRKLMLETGPLVGMIQIPGIRYGVKDVVTLATLNGAIEGAIESMDFCDITNLEAQTSFIAQVLDCWLTASGRAEVTSVTELDPQNVIYQGRILVSVIDLVPAVLAFLTKRKIAYVSERARTEVERWLRQVMERADLIRDGRFISKGEFKELGFLGSGGIGRFRNRLWAASIRQKKLGRLRSQTIESLAKDARRKANESLASYAD